MEIFSQIDSSPFKVLGLLLPSRSERPKCGIHTGCHRYSENGARRRVVWEAIMEEAAGWAENREKHSRGQENKEVHRKELG